MLGRCATLQHALEDLADVLRLSALVTESELVEVVLKFLRTNRTLIGAQ